MHVLHFIQRKEEVPMFLDTVQEREAVSERKVIFNVRSECSAHREFGVCSQAMGSCRRLGSASSDGRCLDNVLTIRLISSATKLPARQWHHTLLIKNI